MRRHWKEPAVKMRFQTALLLLSPLLLLGCVVAQDDPWFVCPEPETITPCVCHKACESGCNAIFFCRNFTTQEEFNEVIKKSDYPFRAARILNSILQYIPHEFFEEKQFHELYITNCTFMSMLDRNLEKDTPLGKLGLTNVVVISGLNYDVFTSMSALYDLSFDYMDVKKIPSNLCSSMPPQLSTLSFFNTKTMKIGDSAFANCRSLEYLSVTGGTIKTVKTSMFPKSLTYLTLTDNKIKSLPNDFVVGMPNLIALYINGNQFSSLDENIFGKIPTLQYVNVNENPLVCDCKLKWKLSHQRPYLEGTCPSLGNRRIDTLTEDDFKIC